MNKTQSTIARSLRKRIGADYLLICSRPADSVSHDEYMAGFIGACHGQTKQSLILWFRPNRG